MPKSNTGQKRPISSQHRTNTDSEPEIATIPLLQPNTQHTYTYSKLWPGEIRLLKLLPGPAHGEEILKGELVSVKISDRPLYTAVSYTWDRSASKTQITIEGEPHVIHQNVHQILLHLRKASYPRLLWIDCICISQSDTDERNDQVRLMRDIFAGANYVVAWLDAGNLATELRDFAGCHWNFNPKDTEASFWFLQHRYWTRRWIVQEILLARSVVLVSNSTEVPLLRIREHFKYCFDGNPKLQSGSLRGRMRSFFFNLFPLQTPQMLEMRLADLLYVHRHAHCAEVIDRVYALISLSPNARLHLNVEYNTSSISLLNHVLDFCVDKEKLDGDGLIWLVLLLKRQLCITNDVLESLFNEKQSGGSLRIGDKAMKTVVIHQLGIVPEPGREHSKNEQYILDSMAAVPPLRKIQQSSWLRCDEVVFEMNPTDMLVIAPPIEEVTSHNLLGFIFEDIAKMPLTGRTNRERPLPPLRAGLSSVWLEPGDQVWQFRRTPTALILRKDRNNPEGGFSIVGKAYILRHGELGWNRYRDAPSDLPLDELLSYHEEGMNTTAPWLGCTESIPREAMHLRLNTSMLLKVLDWIDFDHDRA